MELFSASKSITVSSNTFDERDSSRRPRAFDADHSHPRPSHPPVAPPPSVTSRTLVVHVLWRCGIAAILPHTPRLPRTLTSFRSYYLSGFLTLQTTLDRFMFKRSLPGAPAGDQSEEDSEEGFACVPPDVVGVPFPTASYDQNLFYAAVGYLLGLAMTMVRRLLSDNAKNRYTYMPFELFVGTVHIVLGLP